MKVKRKQMATPSQRFPWNPPSPIHYAACEWLLDNKKDGVITYNQFRKIKNIALQASIMTIIRFRNDKWIFNIKLDQWQIHPDYYSTEPCEYYDGVYGAPLEMKETL